MRLVIYRFSAFVVVMFAFCKGNGINFEDTEDAIVVAAATPLDSIVPALDAPSLKRTKRQFIVRGTSACMTRSGTLGRCVTFKQCYPLFKLPVLARYESWISSMQDACMHVTSSGKQDAGVCCSNPGYNYNELPVYSGAYPDPDSEEFPVFQQDPYPPVNWPPPIPTHPPDHTIPPLPTHPPSAGYPTTSTRRPWTSARPSAPPPDVEDISWNSSECGVKNGYQDQERIVGGHNAEPGEWPWMVGILSSGRLFCGGSLIDETHVLTAAHCVAHMNPWDVARLRVHLGDYNIKSKGDTNHIERKVRKVVRHRGFDPQTLYNDIALLTLDSPVKYSKTVRPICLPRGKALYSGKMATVIGWGSLKELGSTPSILQEVNIPIWTNQECKKKYGNAAPGGIVETFLCAGKANKDSCSGDSGGPLMINDGKWKQIGIVSWGIGCGKGQYPGVYTRLTSFMPWINKNLNT